MKTWFLYNAPQSTCSQRVRSALHAKCLDFTETQARPVLPAISSNPKYLAIKPNGVVPSIIDDGSVVIDSAVILEYLEDTRRSAATNLPSADGFRNSHDLTGPPPASRGPDDSRSLSIRSTPRVALGGGALVTQGSLRTVLPLADFQGRHRIDPDLG